MTITPRAPRPRAPCVIRPANVAATAPPPLAGVWAPADNRLDAADLFPLPSGTGPEDVAVACRSPSGSCPIPGCGG